MNTYFGEDWRYPEQWPKYAVSNLGRVKNMTNGHELRPVDGGRNVMVVTLSEQGVQRTVQLKRLVAELFIPLEPRLLYTDSLVVSHIDENWRNCSAGNLRWCTRRTTAWIRRRGIDWNIPVRDEDSGMVYSNAVECAQDLEYGCDACIALSCADGGGRFSWVLS